MLGISQYLKKQKTSSVSANAAAFRDGVSISQPQLSSSQWDEVVALAVETCQSGTEAWEYSPIEPSDPASIGAANILFGATYARL